MEVRTSCHSPIFSFRPFESIAVMEFIRTTPYNLSPPLTSSTAADTTFQPSSAPSTTPPPLYAVCNLSSTSDNVEPVNETGIPPTIGRPSDFSDDQKEHLQKLVPAYLRLPTKRKNPLKKAFFDTALTEFFVKFEDDLSKEGPCNLKELGHVSHFLYCLCCSLQLFPACTAVLL